MKWFINEFLPSIISTMKFDSEGCGERYISEKQTNICLRYMKPDKYSDSYRIRYNNDIITVYVFKKGYGQFTVYKDRYTD